jgi:hypothetical protein
LPSETEITINEEGWGDVIPDSIKGSIPSWKLCWLNGRTNYIKNSFDPDVQIIRFIPEKREPQKLDINFWSSLFKIQDWKIPSSISFNQPKESIF